MNKKMKYMIVMLLLLLGFKAASEEPTNLTCFDTATIKKDLNELYTKLKASHYDLFVNVTQVQYDQWLVETQAQIKGCLNQQDVALLFQKFVSKGKVAHARIELPSGAYSEYQSNGGRFFPLYVKSDGRKMWVMENYSNNQKIKVGDEIASINGIKTTQLLHTLNAYLSADTDLMYGGFLEFYLGMLLWLEYGELTEFKLVVMQKESSFKVNVNAINLTEREQRSLAGPKSLKLGWERIADIKDAQIAYLRPGPFFNTEGQADDVWDNSLFKKFIEESFEHFSQKQPRALLIDLRNNPGGDNSFSDLMIGRFATKPFKFASKFQVKVSEAFKASNEKRLLNMPKEQVNENSTSVQYQKAYSRGVNGSIFEHNLPLNKPHKKNFVAPVYLLINRHSYSNAVAVAAMAQDYKFAQIIGEETSDLATTYGAMEHFQLTHTGIKVGFPKAFIVRPNGDKTVRGVVPDIKIETPVFESAEDPVLQQALAVIKTTL